MNISELEKEFGGKGVSFEDFHGFPAVRLSNKCAEALISLYGAHVIEYNPVDSEPVLWMSDASVFEDGSPMRGGVPICFPWFGAAPEGMSGTHGFVRNSMWELVAAGITADGGNFATLKFTADDFELFYTVSAGSKLTLSLEINNTGKNDLTFGGALHTYFNVCDAEKISVEDLDGLVFLDTVVNEWGIHYGTLKIDREIDRIFDSCGSVRIVDPEYNRIIHVDKYGSDSTVVWNPWIAKSQRMPDFGDDEYHTMICVEAAKVPKAGDAGVIPPRGTYELRQVIRVEATA